MTLRLACFAATLCSFLTSSVVPAQPRQAPQTTEAVASTSHANETTLFLSLRTKKAQALDDLRASDFIVRDASRSVDPHEIQLSKGRMDPVITVIFDRLDPPDLRHAAVFAQKLLKQVGTLGVPISVWEIDKEVHVLQSYTTDPQLLGAALRTVGGGNEGAILNAAEHEAHLLGETGEQGTTHAQAELRSLSRHTLAAAAQIADGDHLPMGIAALLAAAEEQRALPGRKSIIDFTEETPSGPNAGRVLRSLYEQMSVASISLYAVDLRATDRIADQSMLATMAVGAQAAAMHNAVVAAPKALPGTNPSAATPKTLNMSPSAFRQMNDTIENIEMGGIDGDHQTSFTAVALATGGAALDTEDDAAKLGRRVRDDLANCYQLTIPIASETGSASFHTVDVRSSLKGVTVAAPLGYFAVPPRDGAGNPALSARGSEAGANSGAEWDRLLAGAPTTSLTFHSGVRHTGTAGPEQEEITVQVPVMQLELRKDPTTRLLSLHSTIAAEVLDLNGNRVARVLENFERRGALEKEREIQGSVLTMHRRVVLPAGTYQLHTVVRDWNSDKVGERTDPITLGGVADAAPASLEPLAPGIAKASRAPDALLSTEVFGRMETSMVERDLIAVPAPPPSSEEMVDLIDAVRRNALLYAESLPNFFCAERIDRSTDAKGTGVWKHRDDMVEMLRYRDKNESRTMLEVNGEKNSTAADRIEGARSNGEFGSILHAIFRPEAKADFTWKEAVQAEGDTLYAFGYAIRTETSDFFVSDGNGSRLRTGFHGMVFIEPNTRTVRRLVVQTDALPANFGLRASWMALTYGYLTINNHEYLLPTRGEVGLQRRKGELTLLQLRFSGYHRFGSHARILSPAEAGVGHEP